MAITDIDVAVLAGGLGTRLREVLPATPKILAPLGNRTFLEYLLEWLARQGARRVVMCLGHRSSDVVSFLENRPRQGMDVVTVIEPEPLGTGGAVAFAQPQFRSDPVMVMNGDTAVEADLNAFLAGHVASGADASILCAKVESAGRYGRIEIDDNQRVSRFVEKDSSFTGTAWINAGVYLFNERILQAIGRLAKGSLERDILEKMPAGRIHAFRSSGRFLDIGTPETLALASEVLPI